MAYVVEGTSLDVERLAARVPCRTYVPTYMREIHHARRVETRAFPLYGRYFFAWFDTSALRSVLRVRGVVGVLRRAGSILPAMVDDAFVEGLKSTTIMEDFELGDDVEIRGGRWNGFQGIFSKNDGKRMAVMFSMLGKDCEMWVDRNEIIRPLHKMDGSAVLKQDGRL